MSRKIFTRRHPRDVLSLRIRQGWVTQLLADRGTGSPLLVAATHLKAKADAKSSAMRLMQVSQVRRSQHTRPPARPSPMRFLESSQRQPTAFIRIYSPQLRADLGKKLQPGPRGPPAVVVAGDFNDTPESPCIQVRPRCEAEEKRAAGKTVGQNTVQRPIDVWFLSLLQAMLAEGPLPRLLSTHSKAEGAYTTWKFRCESQDNTALWKSCTVVAKQAAAL